MMKVPSGLLLAVVLLATLCHSSVAAIEPVNPAAAVIGGWAASDGGRKLLQNCWYKVGDSTPCKAGFTPYCCNGDASDATCLGPASNSVTCTGQYGASYAAGWCKNNSC